MRARRSSCSASARADSASLCSRCRASCGDPLGLGAGGGQRLLGLGARLVEQPAGLRLGAGAQLLGPRHVLVDVRLDGLPALGQLLVELLATGDRLLVQLGLQPGRLLGVLLEDALRLGARLAQLPLGVLARSWSAWICALRSNCSAW